MVYNHSYCYSYHLKGAEMKTVQMTLDESLVNDIDKAAKRIGITRSAFTRDALRSALSRLRTKELERRHRDGYTRKPIKREEFSPWEREQA